MTTKAFRVPRGTVKVTETHIEFQSTDGLRKLMSRRTRTGRLIALFIEQPGAWLTYKRLWQDVWQKPRLSTNAIHRQISDIRKLLDIPHETAGWDHPDTLIDSRTTRDGEPAYRFNPTVGRGRPTDGLSGDEQSSESGPVTLVYPLVSGSERVFSRDDVLECLASSRLCEAPSAGERDRLATVLLKLANPITFSANETIIREGDRGDDLYVLLDGLALAVVERDRQQFHPGNFFGEMEWLSPMSVVRRRRGNVRAVRAGCAIQLPSQALSVEVRRPENWHIWRNLAAELVRRLIHTEDEVTKLTARLALLGPDRC